MSAVFRPSIRPYIKRLEAFSTHTEPAARTALDAGAVFGTSFGLPGGAVFHGRAFGHAEMRGRPDPDAHAIGRLTPDQIYPIQGLSADGWWYRLSEGYVPREALQPMLPYHGAVEPPGKPGYYEVIAPFMVIRDYCASYARAVGRLAYGSVGFVHDSLVDNRGHMWYAVSESPSGSGLFGWVQARQMRRWHPIPDLALIAPSIWIDNEHCKLTVYDKDRYIGETAFYSGPILRGTGTLRPHAPAYWRVAMATPTAYAFAWSMSLQLNIGKPLPIYGATWHNRFGTGIGHPAHTPIEIPVFAARWLFQVLGNIVNNTARAVRGREVAVIVE